MSVRRIGYAGWTGLKVTDQASNPTPDNLITVLYSRHLYALGLASSSFYLHLSSLSAAAAAVASPNSR